jgi:hypothetical protein
MAPTISIPIPPGKPKLLDHVREAIRLMHYSIRTEQAYTDWMRRFIPSSSNIGDSEITSFSVSLRDGKERGIPLRQRTLQRPVL